jgi:mannose-6-phosphate isomerase-like protein (cupin superfamily)
MRFLTALPAVVADRPWGAVDIGEVEGASVRVHWTDQPYRWHVNDGAEVFLVLAGTVDMHWREAGREQVRRLEAGDACFAEIGDEHVAHPVGEARILVVERKGSV